MNNFSISTTISPREAESLKEQIFNRARERAQALNDDIENSYTSDIQSDVMNLARASFESNNNPFSKIIDKTENNDDTKTINLEKSAEKINEIKNNIYRNNVAYKEEITTNIVNMNMLEARNISEKRKAFTGALEFLNSKASINLAKKIKPNLDIKA